MSTTTSIERVSPATGTAGKRFTIHVIIPDKSDVTFKRKINLGAQ